MKWHIRSFQFLCVIALLVTSCGGSGQPPLVPPNPVSDNNNGDYLNILINSVEFNSSVGDPDGVGELQLITVVSDESGHSDALICPYGGATEIQSGDIINPCHAGISYPKDLVDDHLYIMIIALDIDDTGTAGDISTGVLSTGLAFGLKEAIAAAGFATTGSAPVVIGFLALDAVIGFAGSKIQEYFENSDVIGSQSFVLSRSSNWNSNNPIVAQSVDGGVEFSFVVQQSSTADGQLVDAAPASQDQDQPEPQPTEAQLAETQPEINTSPRIYDFAACIDPCNGSNGVNTFPANTRTVYISWKYENIPTGSHYVRYWTHNKRGLWMTYDCSWDRDPSGEIDMKLYETGGGLAAGAWTITMEVDGNVVFEKKITIVGNEDYWAPLDPLYKCF